MIIRAHSFHPPSILKSIPFTHFFSRTIPTLQQQCNRLKKCKKDFSVGDIIVNFWTQTWRGQPLDPKWECTTGYVGTLMRAVFVSNFSPVSKQISAVVKKTGSYYKLTFICRLLKLHLPYQSQEPPISATVWFGKAPGKWS